MEAAVVGALMVITITTTGATIGSKASAQEPIDRDMMAVTSVSIDRPGTVIMTSITTAISVIVVEQAPASGAIEAAAVAVISEGAVAATSGRHEEVVAWAAEVARPSWCQPPACSCRIN